VEQTRQPSDSVAYPIAIIGAGSYGRVIAELAEICGFTVISYLDDSETKVDQALGGIPINVPITASLEQFPANMSVAVAIGNNQARLRYLRQAQNLGFQTPSLISPQAVISPSAKVEDACILHVGCHVWTDAVIGYGSILSPHATVAHHTTLGRACFVSTGANVGASVSVGDGVTVGISASISTGVKQLGNGSLVGAGAVVIRDTETNGVYVGNPAKLIRLVKENGA